MSVDLRSHKIKLPGVISGDVTKELLELLEGEISAFRKFAHAAASAIESDMRNRSEPLALPTWPNELLALAKAGGWGLLSQQISLRGNFITVNELSRILKALVTKPSDDSYYVAQVLLYGLAQKRNAS